MNYIPLGGGVTTDDATATASQILSGYTAYVKGKKVSGSMIDRRSVGKNGGIGMSQSYPDVPLFIGSFPQTVQALDGNEYAVISTPEGCYNGLGSSYVGVKTDDINLVAGNIKKGASIFGVSGTFTSDANAGAGDILSGKTAYVNGSKVTGSIPIQGSVKNITTDTSNQSNGCFRVSGNNIQIIPGIGYWKNWSFRTACLQINNKVLSPVIGLTANKIISGYTIFGISGTGSSSSGAFLYMGIPSSPLTVNGYIFGSNASISNGIVTIKKTDMYRIVLTGYNEKNYAAYLKVNNVNRLTINSLTSGSMVHDNLTLNAGDKVTIAVSGGNNFMVCGFINS